MGRPKVDRFEPVAYLRDRLRKLCRASDGLVFADVRWWEQGNCLAVYDLRQDRKTWIPATPLLDSRGWPRQVTDLDIEEAARRLHEARNSFDAKWYQREIIEHNARAEARAQKAWEDEKADIIKQETDREQRGYCWHYRKARGCEICLFGAKRAADARRAKARRKRLAAKAARKSKPKVDKLYANVGARGMR